MKELLFTAQFTSQCPVPFRSERFLKNKFFKKLPVRAELATAGNVMDGHLGPECCVLIGLAHHILGVDVGGVVSKG